MHQLPTPFEQIKIDLTSLLFSFEHWSREQKINNITYLIHRIQVLGDFTVPVHAAPTTQKNLEQLMLHIMMAMSRMETDNPLSMKHVMCHLQALLGQITAQYEHASSKKI